MELQYYGANCLRISTKQANFVIDDNLAELGLKSIIKPEDVAIFTAQPAKMPTARLVITDPGAYEVSNVMIRGVAMRAHMDSEGLNATVYHFDFEDIHMVVVGHIHPDVSQDQIEELGRTDVLIVPVGGNGYTLDSVGALKLIKELEPKLVIPTHYADPAIKYPVPQVELTDALKILSMEASEPQAKIKLKPSEYGETAKLIILERQ